MSRNTSVLEFENKNTQCIYFMTKTFRIYNNYSLYEAQKFAKDNQLELLIYIVEPYEHNETNKKWFSKLIDDLPRLLKEFSNKIYNVKREEKIEDLLVDTNTIFIDKAYLRFDLNYYEMIKAEAYKKGINLFVVESNVFVPVRIASDKEEYSARTIRSKINRQLFDFRDEVLTNNSLTKGEEKAFTILEDFINNKLESYHLHNDPSLNLTSLISPYLKYGLISPVTIYNKLANIKSDNKEAFLEELIVRRELAYNFVYYNPTYDDFKYITYDWAYNTMNRHLSDEREYIYTKEDYINFKTHDKYFNAAMKEMIYLGRMNSYMRMYWCKKIIEWSNTYEEAYKIAIELNDFYFLDGLTPNGYCGVAWCFGKHDRAWTERPVFGKLRYMNANGLVRKFNIEDYVEKMEREEKRVKI